MKVVDVQWVDLLHIERKKKYFIRLLKILHIKRIVETVYPPKELIFSAFFLTPFNKIKVVILGQDPYCYKDQANGLAFSVSKYVKIPPSLRNIFQELENDYCISTNNMNGCLKSWAVQGVLLLNTILTVNEGLPGSHKNYGWEIFTNRVIYLINFFCTGIVFLLWGSVAREKKNIIDKKKHIILESSHPSPLSSYRGFFGCRHFSKTNIFLKKQKKSQINWFKNMFK